MESTVRQVTVLVVDDDRGLVRLILKALGREGFATAEAASGQSAIEWLSRNQADLMLLDLKLPDVTGQELIEQLTKRNRCPPFIIITGQGDERVAVEMMKRGARDYLVKDVDFLQFVPAVVKRSLDQVENERRLAAAEEQVHLVRSVVEQGFSAVLITNAELPDPQILYINPAFAQATGYAPETVIGRPLSAMASLANVRRRLNSDWSESGSSLDEISTYQTAAGERWGEWRIGPVKDKAGKNTHWLISFQDITERKRLEKEILEISDRERQRIGQDLHDGLCQELAGIELMSQVLEQKLAGKSKAHSVRAGEIARHVRDAISQTRGLARGLSPVTLELEGLSSALRELAANTEKVFGVACPLECDNCEVAVGPAVATHLYRIAQEAVSNAIKHGKASKVRISLHPGDGRMELRVSDNGSGLPAIPVRSRGMGLHIMQYRAGMIGASLFVGQNPRGGTDVVCSVPVPSVLSDADGVCMI